MIFYAEHFPWLVRMRVEVSPDERKSGGKYAVDTRNFVFSRTGKRPILRPRVADGRKWPFHIRISVWR